MKKLAIVFPGIGYHSDKPLLYYGKKLAKKYGYEIIETSYTGFKYGIKGNPERMKEALKLALGQAEDILKDVEMDPQDQILFISKSIGTAVAAEYQKKHGIEGKNIYFTPVDETFLFTRPESGITFHGTGDSWAHTDKLIEECEKQKLPLYLTEDADHSMEIGNPVEDIRNLGTIIEQCEEYLQTLDKK